MNYQRTVLSNGLRVLTVPMPSFESATVLVMVGAGSRYENKKNNGISHFLEHMAFKGTKKRPSALHISSLIDGIGGEFNAFTGKETTGYYIKSSANHISLSLDVLSDMLRNSLLDPKEIDKERGVILEEINLYEDTPMRKIGDVYEQLLYGDTPLGWDIAGEKENILSIKREDFVDYMASLYSADNITVVIAGGIQTDKSVKMIDKYMGNMKKFKTKAYEKIRENQTKSAVLLKHKKTEQAQLALGVRTVPNDSPERYPLLILSAILGGGMSSRLFHEVREKRGLAYYVRSNSDHYQDSGSFASMAGVDPKRITEAVEVMVDVSRKIAQPTTANKAEISPDELKKAKEFVKGHTVLELEDSRAVAGFYASQELLEKQIDNPEQVLKDIDAVTKEQVLDVAKRYLIKQPYNLAVIGDFKDRQMFEKLIK